MNRPYQQLLQIVSCLSVDDSATEKRIASALRQEGIVIKHLNIILKLAVDNGLLRRARNRYFLTHPCYLERLEGVNDNAAETIVTNLLARLSRDVCKAVRRFSEEYQNSRDNVLTFFQSLGFRRSSMEAFVNELIDDGFLIRLGSRYKITRRCDDIIHCSEERTNTDIAADLFMERMRKKLHREICDIVRYFQRTNRATQDLILSIFYNRHFEKPYIENVLNQLIEDGLLMRMGSCLASTQLCEEVLREPSEENNDDDDDDEDDEEQNGDDEELCVNEDDDEDENDQTLVMEEDEDDELDRTLVADDQEEDEDNENDRTLVADDQGEDEDNENDRTLVNEEEDDGNDEWKEMTRLDLLRRNICYIVQVFEEKGIATQQNIVSFLMNTQVQRPCIERLLCDLVQDGLITQTGSCYTSTSLCNQLLNSSKQPSQEGQCGGTEPVAPEEDAMEDSGVRYDGGAGEPAPAEYGAQMKRPMDDWDALPRVSKRRRHK